MWTKRFLLALALSSTRASAYVLSPTQLRLGEEDQPKTNRDYLKSHGPKIPGYSSAYYCDDSFKDDIFTVDRLDVNPYPFDCGNYYYTASLTGFFNEAPGDNSSLLIDNGNEDDENNEQWRMPLCDWVSIVQNATYVCSDVAPKLNVPTIMLFQFRVWWIFVDEGQNYTYRGDMTTEDGRRIFCFVGSEVLIKEGDADRCPRW